MVFEGWAGRILTIWLAIGIIGALLDGQVIRGSSTGTEDAQIANEISQGGIASMPATSNSGIVSWMTTGVHVFTAFLGVLVWNSSLFSGAIGSTIRVVFLLITAVAIMGIAQRIFGRS